MARSVIAEAPFSHTVLEFDSEQSYQIGEDDFGNPVYGSRTVELNALVAPYKLDHLRRAEGADPKVIPLRGELVEPLTSEHLKLGTTCRFSYNGQDGTLTITNVILNDVIGVNFGTYFAGDWKAD